MKYDRTSIRMNNLPKGIYTLEFSKSKQLFYFYNHLNSSVKAVWETPEDLILIDKADYQGTLSLKNLLLEHGTRAEQIEFTKILCKYSLKLPNVSIGQEIGNQKPKVTNQEGRPYLRNYVQKKTKTLLKRRDELLNGIDSPPPENEKVNPEALKASLEKVFSKKNHDHLKKDRLNPKCIKRQQGAYVRDGSLSDSNPSSQGEFGSDRPSPNSARSQFEPPPRSRSIESILHTPDTSQSSSLFFKKPTLRTTTDSPRFSLESLTGSNEHIEDNTSLRLDESSPRERVSQSSSSSSAETTVDSWRHRGSGNVSPGNIMINNRGAQPYMSKDVKPGARGPPYTIHMKGTPFSVTRQEVEEFFSGITLTKITLLHGEAEVEVSTQNDFQEAMKKNRQYIGTRYIILQLKEPSSKLGINDKSLNQSRHNGGYKRSTSPVQDSNASKKVKTFEETFNTRREPTLSTSPLMCVPFEKPSMEAIKLGDLKPQGTSTPITNSSFYDLRNHLREKKNLPATVTSSALEEMDWDRPPQEPQAKIGQSNGFKNKQINPTPYNIIFLVCDTSALINEPLFLEKISKYGTYLAAPLKIVIPFVVLGELENCVKKLEEEPEKARAARMLNRLIRDCDKDGRDKYMMKQEGHLAWEAVSGFKLLINDDSVLNCGLQIRDKLGDKETVVLITADINLANKSSAFKLPSHDWNAFRKWIRKFKYNTEESTVNNNVDHEDDRMEWDPNSDEDEEVVMQELDTTPSPVKQQLNNGSVEPSHPLPQPHTLERRSCQTPEPLRKAAKLQNLIKTTVKDMSMEFQELLRQVLNKAVEKQYEHLKQYATPKNQASWTLTQYVREVQNRWALIRNNDHLKPALKSAFSEIIKFTAKSNSERSDWEPDDVENFNTLMMKVVREFFRDYKSLVDDFVHKVQEMKNEYRDEKISMDSESSPVEVISPSDITSSEVETALQQILQYSEATMSSFLSFPVQDQPDPRTLQVFLQSLESLHNALQMLNDISMVNATINSVEILDLINALKSFKNEQGEPYNFDIEPENVLELISNPGYRTHITPILETLDTLRRNANLILHKRLVPQLKSTNRSFPHQRLFPRLNYLTVLKLKNNFSLR